jgi:Immunity protein 42
MKDEIMLLGSKERFGIEFEIDNITPTGIYGHLCFWAGDYKIGDYEELNSVNSATFGIEALLEYKGLRYEPTLWNQPTSVVFHTIHDAIYLDTGQSDEQVTLDFKRYWGFSAIPDGYEIFDDWKGYLIQGDTTARYLWKYYHEPTIHEVVLGVDEFDLRLQEYVDWYYSNPGKILNDLRNS